jgi:glycerol-3-phosphate dehydrogenase
VVGLSRDPSGRVDKVQVETADAHGNLSSFSIRTRAVVNATGVWADQIAAIEDPHAVPRVRPAKGIHITVPWDKIRNDIAVVIPVPQDKRSLFIVPWGPRAEGGFDYAYVGTTDTDYEGPVEAPQCDASDIDYVLHALNAAVETHITAEDVLGVWSGLRPLVRDDAAQSGRTADLSRHHAIGVSPGGVISITGGKLTTYRLMASDCVDEVLRSLGKSRWQVAVTQRSQTRRLALLGAGDPPRSTVTAGETTSASQDHLWARYGSESEQITALITERPDLGSRLSAGLPYLAAEVVFAVRSEMALTVADVCERRFRTHIFDRAHSEMIAPRVADLMASELGWAPEEREKSLSEYLAIGAAERHAALL